MHLDFVTLDVFTTERFGGNPLAVVSGADDLNTETMQTIAREFNLSETVFIQTPETAGNTAKLRIFTPGRELPFAGHPTVGAAVILAERETITCGDVVLEENAGLVTAHVDNTADGAGYAQFTAPVVAQTPRDFAMDSDFAASLSLDETDIGFDGHRPRLVEAGNDWLFLPLASLDALNRAVPSQRIWDKSLDAGKLTGIHLYCSGGVSTGTDYATRMFSSPQTGILEDPATGSAAATLPGQLLASEELTDGTHKWVLEQGFAMGRPSMIYLEADVKKGALAAARIGGHALKVTTGRLMI